MLAGLHRFEAVGYHGLRKIVTVRGHFGAIAILEVRGRHCVRRASVACLVWFRRLRAATSSSCAARLPGSPGVHRVESGDPSRLARVAQTALQSWSSGVFVGREGVTVFEPRRCSCVREEGKREVEKADIGISSGQPLGADDGF